MKFRFFSSLRCCLRRVLFSSTFVVSWVNFMGPLEAKMQRTSMHIFSFDLCTLSLLPFQIVASISFLFACATDFPAFSFVRPHFICIMNCRFESKIISLTLSLFPRSTVSCSLFCSDKLGATIFYHSISFSAMVLQHFLQMGRRLFL